MVLQRNPTQDRKRGLRERSTNDLRSRISIGTLPAGSITSEHEGQRAGMSGRVWGTDIFSVAKARVGARFGTFFEDREMGREEIWEWTIKADANRRYWERIQERYYERVKRSDIGIAISSAVVAGFVNLPNEWGNAGKVFAVISCVGTAILTALQWKKELGHASEIKTKWTAIAVDYELLWEKIKDEDTLPQTANAEYARITKKRAQLAKDDPGFSIDEKLADRCYDEATRSKTNNQIEI